MKLQSKVSNYEFIISYEDNIIVEVTVVGATVVGITDVGATVVGVTEFPSIQSTYVFTFVYIPGRSGLAQPIPKDTTPASFPLQIKGPPLSP